jgi:hypothetical protein
VGALIGQHWGIRGVAVGVLLALLQNYLLMAHLSLALVGSTWREYLGRHVPAVIVSVAALAVAVPVRVEAVHAGAPSFVVLVLCWGAGVAVALGVVRLSARLRVLAAVDRLCRDTRGLLPVRAATVLDRVVGPRPVRTVGEPA